MVNITNVTYTCYNSTVMITHLWDRMQAQDSVSYIKNYFKSGDTVLDYGSGKGFVANEIGKMGCNVQKIDIENFSYDNSPVTIFDGFNTPYGNKCFDNSLCAFVLHHGNSHERILNELARVTKGNIIVCEDLPESILDKLLVWLHTQSSIFRYHSDNMLFRTDFQWKELFKKAHLKLVDEKRISRVKRGILYPVHRKIYVLHAA